MYCSKCGSELDEYSLICLECGNVVNKGKHRKKQTPNKFDIEKMFQITNYISVVCICLVALFHSMFLLEKISGGGLICALIFSICACVTAITSFVLSFKQELKACRFKSDAILIVALCLVVISIIGYSH